MHRNDLLKKGDSIIRILAIDGERALVMNCTHPCMPKWLSRSELDGFAFCAEKDLYETTGIVLCDVEALDAPTRRAAYERYTVIAGILPYITDESRRTEAIHLAVERFDRTDMTVRKYLYLYLAFDSVSVLAPKPTATEQELTQMEKVMRWGLNKFYYTAKKHSLRQSYTLLLKEKFCDETGQLKESYPTFSQYRYFYYAKYRDIRKQSISRDGLKEYQKNVRPLLGDGVHAFAPAVGVGMCDATILDIYLIDEEGNVVGRPMLTACLDAYSRLLMGYTLSWEGGAYPALQLSVGTDLGIEGILAPRDIMCVQSADVFECIETHIIKKIADSLRNGSLDYDAFERVIATRNNSLWYAAHKAEYEMMQAAISFFRLLEKPIAKDLLATEYIRNYTEGYYLADTYYRRACVAYKQIENPIFELEALIDRVELHYQDRFLQEIGREFSKSLESVQGWQFPGFPSTREFFRKVQANNYKKCFVIISDGFRYEIGRELYERIKVDTVLKGTEEIKCAIAPLPSETRFGMASLLPHQTLSYQDKAVLADGKPTNSIAARDAILKEKSPSCAAISYDDINNMQRADLRTYMADKSIVYVYFLFSICSRDDVAQQMITICAFQIISNKC